MTANPGQGQRGLDFSMGNGNTKLTAQSGSLPLPNLSGRPNGPVGTFSHPNVSMGAGSMLT